MYDVENPDWTRAEQDPGVPDLQTITEHLGRLRQGIRAQFREILTRSVPEGAEADWGDSWEASGRHLKSIWEAGPAENRKRI